MPCPYVGRAKRAHRAKAGRPPQNQNLWPRVVIRRPFSFRVREVLGARLLLIFCRLLLLWIRSLLLGLWIRRLRCSGRVSGLRSCRRRCRRWSRSWFLSWRGWLGGLARRL